MKKRKRPIVLSSTRKFREGRGFSIGELKLAKISLREARRMNIIVDKRRRSVHNENVKALSELFKGPVSNQK